MFEGYLRGLDRMIEGCEESKRKHLREIDEYVDKYVRMLEEVRKRRKEDVMCECDKIESYLRRMKEGCEDFVKWLKDYEKMKNAVETWDDYRECLFEKSLVEQLSRMEEIEERIGRCGDGGHLEIELEMSDIPSEESVVVVKKRSVICDEPVPKPTPEPLPPPSSSNHPDIAGYKEVEEGLRKDKEGKHEEAMELYEKAGELGNKAAFLNMGNCYMFGKGVKLDEKKGVEIYGRCGRINDDELGWIREVSNDRFVCWTQLNLSCLF